MLLTIETVLMFALEPTGSKFAILHGDPPTRISVSFYRLEKGAPVTKISEFCQKFETSPSNHFSQSQWRSKQLTLSSGALLVNLWFLLD